MSKVYRIPWSMNVKPELAEKLKRYAFFNGIRQQEALEMALESFLSDKQLATTKDDAPQGADMENVIASLESVVSYLKEVS